MAELLSKKDFESHEKVKWCPGCGDYAILAALQKALVELNVPPEKHVFVSGIGCSSRLPYYLNTYGFHTIHGRAMAVAGGVKLANPALTVWVITGDGDALSIGGNHFIHLMRRNLDVNVILFNNQIYGLTKGQVSPTSPLGTVTKSSPYGSIDPPVDPVSLALTCGATFVARMVAVDVKKLAAIFKQAVLHRGTSFVEVLQNCVVFNDGAFAQVVDRAQRSEYELELNHAQPLVYGGDEKKGIVLQDWKPVIVPLGGEEELNKIVRHDKTNKVMAAILAQFALPHFPLPLGVFYEADSPPYEDVLENHIARAVERRGRGDLDKFLKAGDAWLVT